MRNITFPEYDVRTYIPPEGVYGILAAPPCTHFSIACNRLWDDKDKDGRTINGLSVLIGCMRVIALAKPVFWVIENPVGRMRQFLGEPRVIINYWEYGYPCKKKALLWGNFNKPAKGNSTVSKFYKLEDLDSKMPELYAVNGIVVTDHGKRAAVRSITPPGFSEAFFKANQ